MNDCDEMRAYLESATEKVFCELMYSQGSDIVHLDDGSILEVDIETGGHRDLSRTEWRQQLTEELLALQETNKVAWNRLCHTTRVEMDSAKHVRHAEQANRRANWAFGVSILALVCQMVNLIFR